LAEAGGFSPYRAGQGIYARAAAAGSLIIGAVFACWRLYVYTITVVSEGSANPAFTFVGLPVSYAVLVSVGAFVLLAAVTFLFTFGPTTGARWLDSKTHGLIDLLVDTESELSKVSWPTREDLTSSTAAVLVLIAFLSAFLFGVDLMIGKLLTLAGVLGGPGAAGGS
jgi:preprotein translocase SecE subunit